MEDTSLKLHYQTYLDNLVNDIREYAAEEGLQLPFAAERVIAQRLGYDLEDLEFIDGAGDRGIDFWYATEDGLYIFQVKTRQVSDRGIFDYESLFDHKGVTDLMRAYNFLMSPDEPNHQRLVGIKDALNHLVKNHVVQNIENPISVRLTLVILGKTLTDKAFTELADFERSLENPVIYGETPLQFYVDFQTLDNVLEASWRETNHEWVDKDGRKVDSIRLTPMRQTDNKHYLHDNRSAIFYCRALDLVEAYRSLGYQIFEPNVRASIRNSSVNHAIQQSASRNRSMKEFRFLNNGLTITCNAFKPPAGQRAAFDVTHPGIVNGLQTVVALERAYHSLPEHQKVYFADDCYVLVRLLQNDAVEQISQVVFATNNQNPMQRRNLV
ncbi:MAG: AIPR family protein [Chloroflexota bacterium]